MAKTKGVALISRLDLLKTSYGQEGLDAVLAAMKPQNSELLNNVLFSGWYDAEIYKDLNKSIKKVLGPKEPMIMEKIGELTAEASMKGVYSAKLKENNVRLTLDRAASLWRAFHDSGDLEIEVSETENRAIMRVKDYPLPHKEFCDNLVGWGRRLISLSGGENAQLKEVRCVCKGAPYCEMIATWD